jgi:ssDNA thymidine ADP-ribosyltransferase, DarT
VFLAQVIECENLSLVTPAKGSKIRDKRRNLRVDMPPYPANQKIWHITHWENLPGILQHGALLSDAKRLEMKLNCSIVGMSKIKERRLKEIEVSSHPGTMVGQYVPFYFCPRSVMLYILFRGNSPDLDYAGGQGPIVHLQADLKRVIDWAEETEIQWAFSDRNAGAYFATFSSEQDDLAGLDWAAIGNPDFRSSVVKEGKQAEFLVFESFPWDLFECVGVYSERIRQNVEELLEDAQPRPNIIIRRDWYY